MVSKIENDHIGLDGGLEFFPTAVITYINGLWNPQCLCFKTSVSIASTQRINQKSNETNYKQSILNISS
jgi:hypothetical protein